MYKIKLYAHKIAPIKDGVGSAQWIAIDIVACTAQALAKMLDGRAECDSDGVIQDPNSIVLKKPITKEVADIIETVFPFSSCARAIE